MNEKSLKQLLDSCFLAKRIVETLPELPHGMKPRHIHVLDAVNTIQKEQEACRVSDVSTALNITMPSITKLIQELDSLRLVEKYTDESDKRVTLLRLTKQGERCVEYHVTELHARWAKALEKLPDEKARETADIMEELWRTMPGREEKKNGRKR